MAITITKPVVGASEDSWGDTLNTALDDIVLEINSNADGTNPITLQEGGFLIGETAVTATGAELNVLDGVTATTAELNILDGVTATTAELNLLDGVTATTTEINYLDGVTSNIQTQINNIVASGGDSNSYVNGGSYSFGTLTLTRNDLPNVTVTGFPTAVSSLVNDAGYLTSAPTPTSAQVGSATAGLSYGSLGTYVFAGRYLSGSHTFVEGSIYAGSALKPAGAGVAANTMSDGANQDGYPAGGGSVLSGQWRAMGRQYRASSGTAVTLFLKVTN